MKLKYLALVAIFMGHGYVMGQPQGVGQAGRNMRVPGTGARFGAGGQIQSVGTDRMKNEAAAASGFEQLRLENDQARKAAESAREARQKAEEAQRAAQRAERERQEAAKNAPRAGDPCKRPDPPPRCKK